MDVGEDGSRARVVLAEILSLERIGQDHTSFENHSEARCCLHKLRRVRCCNLICALWAWPRDVFFFVLFLLRLSWRFGLRASWRFGLRLSWRFAFVMACAVADACCTSMWQCEQQIQTTLRYLRYFLFICTSKSTHCLSQSDSTMKWKRSCRICSEVWTSSFLASRRPRWRRYHVTLFMAAAIWYLFMAKVTTVREGGPCACAKKKVVACLVGLH